MRIQPINKSSVQTFRAQNNLKSNRNKQFKSNLEAQERYDQEQNEIYQNGKKEMFNIGVYTIATVMPIFFVSYINKSNTLIDRQKQIIEQQYNDKLDLQKKVWEKQFECDSLKIILDNKEASQE